MDDKLEGAALEARIQSELFSSYYFALGGCALAVPLSRYVPSKARFAPLVVLGVTGSLLDFVAGQRRAEPFQQRKLQLEAAAREAAAREAAATTRVVPAVDERQ